MINSFHYLIATSINYDIIYIRVSETNRNIFSNVMVGAAVRYKIPQIT